VNVRHARATEAAALRAIRLNSLQSDPEAFGSTYERDAAHPQDWWERMATRSEDGGEQRTFVAVDDADRWLGLAVVRADDEAPGDAVLNAMWVAPEARHQGAARALCNACAEWAAEHGFRVLNAAVVVGNDAARRAYESAGFTFSHATTWTGDSGRTLDELILTRTL
jgi:RimJ/RimL family protein N-acetyltransferase